MGKKIILIFLSVISFIILSFLVIFLIKPNIEENIIYAEIGNEIVFPKTTYFFKDVTNSIKYQGEVNYNEIGEYEITLEIPIIFNRIYKQKMKLKIIDITPPEIILDEEVTLSYKDDYKNLDVKAIDNYDGDITSSITIYENKISENELEIIYTVSDSSLNKTSKTQKINLVDNIKPNIKLNGSSKIVLNLNDKYEELGASAIDEKDGDLTNKIEILSNVDTSKIGNYSVTYKVKDSKGNEDVKKRIVEVKKIENKNYDKKGVIYLTFDDGPSSDITPKILDILKKKNIKATFFILNYDDSKEHLVKREINEGHSVGIHGYSHNYTTIYQSLDSYMNNITILQNKIKNSTGYNTIITRFPGGSSNTVSKFNPGIMTILTKEVVNRGYLYYDWNIDSDDAGRAKTKEKVYKNVINNLSKTRPNVVLMHDFNNNYKTLYALEDIIDYGINNGYVFETINENTPMVKHGVNN